MHEIVGDSVGPVATASLVHDVVETFVLEDGVHVIQPFDLQPAITHSRHIVHQVKSEEWGGGGGRRKGTLRTFAAFTSASYCTVHGI